MYAKQSWSEVRLNIKMSSNQNRDTHYVYTVLVQFCVMVIFLLLSYMYIKSVTAMVCKQSLCDTISTTIPLPSISSYFPAHK